MKAAVYDRYGPADVLRVEEVARPPVGDKEILVQIVATTVTTADWRMRAAAFPGILAIPGRLIAGLLRPRHRVLGGEFAGRVVSAGPKVTRFSTGDAVFGFAMRGAHAEYIAVAEDGAVAAKPESLSFEEAAAVPFGGLSALVFLRDFARLKPGQKVLVAGASGGVGVWAVQLARHLGAAVTAVASTANVALVRELGAETVVDYTKEDFTASGETYDLIIDTAGTTDFATARRALTPGGIFLPLEFGGREMLQALWTRIAGGPKVVIGVSGDSPGDLEMLAGLLASGTVRPVIDSRFPLAAIADAHRRVEGRHKRGSVVVSVAGDGD